jgi:tetratricopeptide (TPR) repeat protein
MRIGRYEVLGELGRGGVGVVYRVRTPEGGTAALKVLRGADASAFARFDRERRLLASLGEREGFVGLLDAGTSSGGAWLLMPLVPGGTLRQRLEEGPLGVEETIVLGLDLSRALGTAHARGIVHRDVKPENVLFTASSDRRGGRALLADLGLAKHFDPHAAGASQSVALTRSGVMKGTAAYMAPEQVEHAAHAGPPSDVFALGAVLHECLSGKPAFEGETWVEVLARVRHGRCGPLARPDAPPWLVAVIRRALAPDPRARFADGGALARALGARGAKEGDRGRRSIALLAAGTALGGVLLGVVLGRSGPRATPPAGPPPAPRPSAPETRPPAPATATLVERTSEAIGRGDWDAAVAAATRAIELDPSLAVAWGNRGLARGQKGDRDGEISDVTRALELDPRLATAWCNRSSARSRRGDWDGSISDATRAIELDPRIATAWTNRGAARGMKLDFDGGISDVSRAIELDPGLVKAWMCRGELRAQKGDLDGEIADETRALEIDPTQAIAWLDRAAARGQKGDHPGAISDATKAIELNPRLADAWMNRGAARANSGDDAGAVADLEHALELEPTGSGADFVRQVLASVRAHMRR